MTVITTGPAACRDSSVVTADLPTGRLTLTVESSRRPVEDLLGFAARANPRRAFLFLSKVLGKHHPVRPADMAATHRLLADDVPAVGGPVVFIGMAETATGLGQGVFEAWIDAHPGAPALYLQTTRYRVDHAQRLDFEEAHSHAPRVFLHLPTDPAERASFTAARRVVLVDDELSTGNTFVNLVAVLRHAMPHLAGVHLATLADFMGARRRSELGDTMGMACSVGALIRGSWQFEHNGATIAAPAAQCAEGHEVRLADAGYGRLGRSQRLRASADLVGRLAAETVPGTTLVVGTGEFMHAAFVLGRALEAAGADVRVQATTRSPILRWGAVTHALAVPDPYHEGVANFIYNFAPGRYARVLICHETAPDPALFELARLLDARLIHFQPDDHAEEVPVC